MNTEKQTLPTFEEGVVESIKASFLNTTWIKKEYIDEHIGCEIIPLTIPAYEVEHISETESELSIHWANLDVKLKLEWEESKKPLENEREVKRVVLKKISLKA